MLLDYRIKSIVLLLVCRVSSLLHTTVHAKNIYTLARAPQLSVEIINKTWIPFVKYLSDKTGNEIKLKVYTSRRKFEADIERGSVDFYFGSPAYRVIGHELHG